MISIRNLALASLFGAAGITSAQDDAWEPLGNQGKGGRDRRQDLPERQSNSYWEAIKRTAAMVDNSQAQRLVQGRGLNILNVTWEDTGRYKNSSVGPNISDMTIQVGARNPRTRQYEVTLMPVIRYPNFSDLTTDLDAQDFTLLVGNEKGQRLRRVSLYDFLADPTEFLSNPRSWRGRNRSLLAERDDKVLVSAQACFLPVPRDGKATFNPVVFNYQSVSGDPAVLTILATREGTSTTVIDNKRDAFAIGDTWGQRLFHNADGQRASLTGERMSDYLNKGGRGQTGNTGMSMVLLIQVPLKQRQEHRYKYEGAMDAQAPAMMKGGAGARSNVEAAVIGHGRVEGPFTEIDNLAIERDPRFPIRVTVQFYKATSNGVVSPEDVSLIKEQIASVYDRGDVVGSLVTGGHTGRPTEYWGVKRQPRDWWEQFWRRYEADMGEDREDAERRLRRLMGRDYYDEPVCELYLRDVLRKN